MKFYIEKGEINDIKGAIDSEGEFMSLITLTESQADDLKNGKTVLIREKKREYGTE